jgi:hypothetical protein
VNLGRAHVAADPRGARDVKSSEARALEWRPLASHLPRRLRPSLSASATTDFLRQRAVADWRPRFYAVLFTYLCQCQYVFMIHCQFMTPSIFYIFMIFLFTFYVNICRILSNVQQCIISSICIIISIIIYHKLVLTSLTAWLLERLYIYGRNKALKIKFFVSMHANLFPFNSHSSHPKFVCIQ